MLVFRTMKQGYSFGKRKSETNHLLLVRALGCKVAEAMELIILPK